MRTTLARLRAGIFELLSDGSCPGCGAAHRPVGTDGSAGIATVADKGGPIRSRPLCPSCWRALPWLAQGSCRLCQENPALRPRQPCAACSRQAWRTELTSCTAATAFEGMVRDWVHALKYPGSGLRGLDPQPRRLLAALVEHAARMAPGRPALCIVPIPLHPARLRARRFNPAALLARDLARKLQIPFRADLLQRVRDTPSQTDLGRRQRRRNLAGAFRCARAQPAARIWLVDDVVTTGATLAEAARALRTAGAREVSALCAARTLLASKPRAPVLTRPQPMPSVEESRRLPPDGSPDESCCKSDR